MGTFRQATLRVASLLAATLLLSACGFQLRDSADLPPEMARTHLVIDGQYSPLARRLRVLLEQSGAELVQAEAGADRHHVIAGPDGGAEERADQILRAVADDDAIGGGARAACDGRAQAAAGGVRIAPHSTRRLAHRMDGAGRGAERAFVAVQLGDAIDAVGGAESVQREARVVLRQIAHILADQVVG